jgi:hypothetical protein
MEGKLEGFFGFDDEDVFIPKGEGQWYEHNMLNFLFDLGLMMEIIFWKRWISST